MDEALLLALASQGGGGGGGTNSYTDLTNKPKINGVTLSGNKTSEELGITSAVETTYSALKALRDGGNLVPGTWYRITDYVTKITGYYDLSMLGAQGYLQMGKSAEHPYDVIVLATSASELNENAFAALHAGDTYFANSNLDAWELKYTIDNDTSRFSFADTTNGKGVVYWMKDEFGNEAWYDFKNVLSLRYALKLQDATADYTPQDTGLVYNASSQPNRYGSAMQIFAALQAYMQAGTYVNPWNFPEKAYGDYDFAVGSNILGVIQFAEINATYLAAFNAELYYTFDFFDGSNHIDASLNGSAAIPCFENHIDFCADITEIVLAGNSAHQGIAWNVFESNAYFEQHYLYGNKLGINAIINTFGDKAFGNKIGEGNYGNTFGNSCNSNTFGNSCYSNTFGSSCYSNTFGNQCNSNTFGNSCNFNTFGNQCYSNTFGSSCYSNTFGNQCNSNTFGSSCYSNAFGNSCGANTFGYSCNSNTFGNDCDSNTFGNGCYSNTFGSSCDSNTFGNQCYSNTFGNSCNSNTFGNQCNSNTFGDNCDFNTFGNLCYSNTFGNLCYSNTFGTLNGSGYTEQNKFGENCRYIRLAAGTDVGDNSIRNYEIKNGVHGTSQTPYEPTVTKGNLFITCIGYNSQGNIVSWVPADQA